MAGKIIKSAERIQLPDMRLSFPSLFERSSFEGNDDGGKYEATCLFPKTNTALIAHLSAHINALIQQAGVAIPPDRWCISDGDYKEYDGYAGHYALKTSTKRRPNVFDRDLTPIDSNESERLYAGCYVNVSMDFWIQNNSYGKRVNANLYGVQFSKDGEPFGEVVDVTEDFAALPPDASGLTGLGDQPGFGVPPAGQVPPQPGFGQPAVPPQPGFGGPPPTGVDDL